MWVGWYVYMLMVAGVAGGMILDQVIEAVRDLVAEWRAES